MRNFIIATIGILIALSIFVLVNTSRTSQTPKSPTAMKKEAQKIISMKEKLQTYVDPSGFTFQYPEGLIVSKKESQNKELYSSLEINASGPAAISIKAETSDLITVDDWFKSYKKTSIFGEVRKIKLAELDARQFEANNARITIALDQGVLFTLTTNAKKDDILSKTYEKIILSFAFIQPSSSIQNSSNQSVGESDVVDEGEEVIE